MQLGRVQLRRRRAERAYERVIGLVQLYVFRSVTLFTACQSVQSSLFQSALISESCARVLPRVCHLLCANATRAALPLTYPSPLNPALPCFTSPSAPVQETSHA
eukprot:3398783-Rhodomonas_salina.1